MGHNNRTPLHCFRMDAENEKSRAYAVTVRRLAQPQKHSKIRPYPGVEALFRLAPISHRAIETFLIENEKRVRD